VVLVDTGDFTGVQSVSAPTRGLFHLEMQRKLAYDAVTLGHGDALLGADLVRALAEDPSLPIVSANLRDRERRRMLFPATRVVEKGGLRIGITAVTAAPAGADSGLAAFGIESVDPATALADVLPRLREDCDVTVVLARMTLAQAKALGDRFPGQIDVVALGGADQVRDATGRENGDAVYATFSDRGQGLGRARLALDAKKRVTAAVADEVLLFRDLPEPEEIVDLVAVFQENLNELLKEESVRSVRGAASSDGSYFVGAKTCGDCHAQEHQIWAETRHASAFSTLVLAGSENLPECYRCHVTGSDDPVGYAPGTKDAADLVDVQCEVCHGKGSHHSRDGAYGASLAHNACAKCHDPHNSPDFDHEVYWLMIEH
jgi:hypothetical protein